MKILAIDTSTKYLSLGAYDGASIYEYTIESGVKLSEIITPTLERVLESLDWKVKDIDFLASGVGPGSFTGIRIGLATIKGLSWSLHKPIASLPTLDVLARNVTSLRNPLSEGYIIPMVDAKRNLIYCSIYQMRKGKIVRISPYMLLALNECMKIIKKKIIRKADKCIFLGDALSLYKEQVLINMQQAIVLDKDYWYPEARQLIFLARKIIEDKKLVDSFNLKAIYLYPKECQVSSKYK